MDPDTAFRDLIDAICRGDADAASELAEGLAEWVGSGGFWPGALHETVHELR